MEVASYVTEQVEGKVYSSDDILAVRALLLAEVNSSEGSVAAAKAAFDAWIATQDDVSPHPSYGNIFTLTEITGLDFETLPFSVTPIVTKEVYWGGADKESVADAFYDFVHNGVPLAELLKVIEMYAGLDFVQLGLINVTNDLAEDTARFPDYADVRDFTVTLRADYDVEGNNNDPEVWVDIVVDFFNGSQSWAEVAISQQYFDLINVTDHRVSFLPHA